MNKIISFIKKNYAWIIFCICIILFLTITEDVFEKEIMNMDTIAYQFFIENVRNSMLTHFMTFITKFGNAITLLLLVILSFIFLKIRKVSLCITGNLFFITLINQGLKFIAQRPRPDGYQLITESGYSFPSGHSMISVAFFGFLIYLLYKYVKSKQVRYISYVLLTTLIVLICISRIYLGVHYASDVIAGAMISIAYLIIFIKTVNKFILRKEENNEKIKK